MTHKTPDGYVILLPIMDIHTLVNSSQAEFIQELLAKNPTLPATQLTRNNLLCCVIGLRARLGEGGPFSADIRAQFQTLQQRWISSTAGDVLHQLFDGTLRKPSAHLPSSAVSTMGASMSKPQGSLNITAQSVSAKGTDLRPIDMARPITTPSTPKRVGSSQYMTRERPRSKPSGSEGMLPYNPNVIVQIPQLLVQDHGKKLMRSGNCLLVSLPSETESAAIPTQVTHAHLMGHTDNAGSLCQIQLLMASYPCIVLAFDSKSRKDLAAQQIEDLKFQFEDKDPIRLDVEGFSDNPAGARATYTLGSGPLFCCNYQESLQQFFRMEGYVPIKDVIKTRRTGVLKTELLIRYRFSPGFLEKLTALPGDHEDNRIPAEPAESCSICPHQKGQDQLQSSSKNALQPNVKLSSLPSAIRGADADASARPLVKIPGYRFASAHASLNDLKITSYIAAFTSLNGVEVTRKIKPRLFVRGFNKFLDAFYPGSDFEARLAVLHRIDGGERAGDWELLCRELRSHFTVVYMSASQTMNSKRKSFIVSDEADRKRPKRSIAADFM